MKIYHQSSFDPWPLESGSVQAIITSPPYWGLRKYDIPDVVIGGRMDCEHEWGPTLLSKGNGDGTSFRRDKEAGFTCGELSSGLCIHCGAFKGQYGLEPTYQLYIKHTLLWCVEAMRVLKDDGVMFLNLGDTYQSGNRGGYHRDGIRGNNSDIQKGNTGSLKVMLQPNRLPQVGIKSKCQLAIPERVMLGLIDAGWVRRNGIIWFKRNAMPESCTDRFSKKYELIYMFTKSPDYYFDLDAVREPHSPDGRKKTTLEGHKYVNRSSGERWPGDGRNPGDVWEINTQPSAVKHYAMWPEALVERMVKCSTSPGDVVLDPFCGSGRTLAVADGLNRVAIGIDLGYADIQKKVLSGIQKVLI